eukprot:TRINITY_DN3613_c0_g1_i1.p1 TRINITY_DN3613_c0_g1~~TRINITY_DN3613_c0_g1_i1.p1  ORF type:complete len:367 (-),score=58.10 TRINITY_DN3613_c0_g1_i1:467-1567(-)
MDAQRPAQQVFDDRTVKLLRVGTLLFVAFFCVAFFDLEWSIVDIECPAVPSTNTTVAAAQAFISPRMKLRFYANHVEAQQCCCNTQDVAASPQASSSVSESESERWPISAAEACCDACKVPLDYRACSHGFCDGPRDASYVFIAINASLVVFLGIVCVTLRYRPEESPTALFLFVAVLSVSGLTYAWINLAHNPLQNTLEKACVFKYTPPPPPPLDPNPSPSPSRTPSPSRFASPSSESLPTSSPLPLPLPSPLPLPLPLPSTLASSSSHPLQENDLHQAPRKAAHGLGAVVMQPGQDHASDGEIGYVDQISGGLDGQQTNSEQPVTLLQAKVHAAEVGIGMYWSILLSISCMGLLFLNSILPMTA